MSNNPPSHTNKRNISGHFEFSHGGPSDAESPHPSDPMSLSSILNVGNDPDANIIGRYWASLDPKQRSEQTYAVPMNESGSAPLLPANLPAGASFLPDQHDPHAHYIQMRSAGSNYAPRWAMDAEAAAKIMSFMKSYVTVKNGGTWTEHIGDDMTVEERKAIETTGPLIDLEWQLPASAPELTSVRQGASTRLEPKQFAYIHEQCNLRRRQQARINQQQAQSSATSAGPRYPAFLLKSPQQAVLNSEYAAGAPDATSSRVANPATSADGTTAASRDCTVTFGFEDGRNYPGWEVSARGAMALMDYLAGEKSWETIQEEQGRFPDWASEHRPFVSTVGDIFPSGNDMPQQASSIILTVKPAETAFSGFTKPMSFRAVISNDRQKDFVDECDDVIRKAEV